MITGGSPPPAAPRRCLLVDDETDTADVLRHHLDHLGYLTTIAATGSDAAQLLHEGTWSLVIIDVVLPDIDGRDLIGSIRTLEPSPDVILTSVLSAGDLVGHHADALLTKPFRGPDVRAALHLARKAA